MRACRMAEPQNGGKLGPGSLSGELPAEKEPSLLLHRQDNSFYWSIYYVSLAYLTDTLL